MQLPDSEGSSQTFSMPPFSIAPEDVDTEIETDDGVHDINTLFNRLHELQLQLREKEQTLHELQLQLREKEQTLREQTAMLMVKEQTVREQEQTIHRLLAGEGILKWLNLCVVQ
jgi:vacuolar-type H+-ATPase subunit I/STV1